MDPVMQDLGSYLNGLEEQEAANWGVCFTAALAAGITQEQAENCDEGEYNCSTCPWRTR